MCLALFLLTLSCTSSTGGEKRGKSKEEVLPGVTADYKLSEDGALLTLIFECECEYDGRIIRKVRDVDRPNEREWKLVGKFSADYVGSFEIVVPQGETWEIITAVSNASVWVGLYVKGYSKWGETLMDNGIEWHQVWRSGYDGAILLEGGHVFRILLCPFDKKSYIRTELKMRRYK